MAERQHAPEWAGAALVGADVIWTLHGSCQTAGLVEAGVVSSSVEPSGWHALCTPSTIDGRGRVRRCSCECHAVHDTCVTCKVSGDDAELDPVTLMCVDREACGERNAARVAELPKMKRYAEYDRLTAEAKAREEAELTPEQREARQVSRRGPGKPTSGVCNHCGQPTKGGLFVMGHDAKLKGILMRAGQAGDLWAVVELHARGWFPKPGNRTIAKYPQALLVEADREVQDHRTDEVIRLRTEQRLALVAAGTEPEMAVILQGDPYKEAP